MGIRGSAAGFPWYVVRSRSSAPSLALSEESTVHFHESVCICCKKYAGFAGTASRSEAGLAFDLSGDQEGQARRYGTAAAPA
jgi:hypothetical protein